MALSAAKHRSEKISGSPGNTLEVPVAASQLIYQGAIVMRDSAGRAREAVALAANLGGCGIATETVDNSSGAAEAKNIKVKSGVYLLTGTGFTQALIGSRVYASDDDTVSTTQGANEPLVGVIVGPYVSTTQAWVEVFNVEQRTSHT